MKKAVVVRRMRYWIAFGVTGLGLIFLGLSSPVDDVSHVVVGSLYLAIALLVLMYPERKARAQTERDRLVARIFELAEMRHIKEFTVLRDPVQDKLLVARMGRKKGLVLVLAEDETDFFSPNGTEAMVTGTVYAMMYGYRGVIRRDFVGRAGEALTAPSLPDSELIKSMPGLFTASDDELQMLITALEEWKAVPGH